MFDLGFKLCGVNSIYPALHLHKYLFIFIWIVWSFLSRNQRKVIPFFSWFFCAACRRVIRSQVAPFSCEAKDSMWGLRSSRSWQWRFLPSGMRNLAMWQKFTDFRRSLLHPSSGSRCRCGVVSYKFTDISEEYITVVFRVSALYLRGCDVLNPEVVLPTFGGTFCLLLQDTVLITSVMWRRILC